MMKSNTAVMMSAAIRKNRATVGEISALGLEQELDEKQRPAL